jgi:UDP-N-acetylglucosamine transferase subunit ALG13
MVFVTVGNATQEFRRLLYAVDTLAGAGFFQYDLVFIQTGHSRSFHSQRCTCTPFLTIDEFEQRMEKADLIICHGGCTQLQVIRLGKVPVVMPRRKMYDEHVNDHQMQLVQALAQEGLVVPAYEPDDLADAISAARRCRPKPTHEQASHMISLVSTAIDELMGLDTNR